MTILKAWFYFYWHRTICNIIWVSGVPHNYSIFLCIKMITKTTQCPITIFHLSYYYIIDYISYAVHDIPVTYFIAGNFYFNLPYLFHSSLFLPTLWQAPVCSLSESAFVFIFVCFLDPTYKWKHVVLSFPFWHVSPRIILFRSIHIVTNGKTSYFVVELYEFFVYFE